MKIVKGRDDTVGKDLLVGIGSLGSFGIVEGDGHVEGKFLHIGMNARKSNRFITIDLDYNVCSVGECRRATARENRVQFSLPLVVRDGEGSRVGKKVICATTGKGG